MTVEYYKEMVENAISCLTECDNAYSGLLKSMNYSLLAGGKRIRPTLVLEFCRLSGGDVNIALPVAAAIEMIHTYSLIHDDLPCMDNDDLRRGKPTNHKVFGECTAVLAGDALQAEAYRSILKADISQNAKVNCCLTLSEASGLDGMCGGQYLDTACNIADFESLKLTDSLKTGALLEAACKLGVLVAEGTENQVKSAELFGKYFGLAFQIRDDVLDVIGDSSILGKNTGSDEKIHKSTYMSLLGEKECIRLIDFYSKKAISSLSNNFPESDFLVALINDMISRVY